jgi:hypothetical protein
MTERFALRLGSTARKDAVRLLDSYASLLVLLLANFFLLQAIVRRYGEPSAPPKRRPKDHPPPLHWLEEDVPRWCEYCGGYLDFAATRRKQFCSDICRVRAWRVRQGRAGS